MDFNDPKAVTIWLTRAIAYVAYAFFILTEIILLQGFLLKLFGANPTSDYVQWAYRSLDRVMAPFRGIFTEVELDGNAVLDPSIIFAMVIYGIVALLLRAFLDWLNMRLARLERERMMEAQQQAAMAANAQYQTPPPAAPAAQPQQAPIPATEAPPSTAQTPYPDSNPAPPPDPSAPRH
ncbi:MAG: hypothetical protein ACR2PK_14745 [Acidimicrobiales bacterium]